MYRIKRAYVKYVGIEGEYSFILEEVIRDRRELRALLNSIGKVDLSKSVDLSQWLELEGI